MRKEAQLGKALYAEEKITEFFNKLKSKETEPPLEKQIYMMKQITEQANKEYDWLHEDEFRKETSMEENFYPLEKKSSRVEANFQQEDNFQGLENVDNTGVEENFMGKNTSRVENNFQSKLDNINSIVDKIIVGFADIIKNINKLSDLRTTKNLISNQSA